MKEPDPFIPESLRPSKVLPPSKPSRSVPITLSRPSAQWRGMNQVSIQTLGLFSVGLAALILYVALFDYDIDVGGTVNLTKMNTRLCWVIVGTGTGLGGLLLFVLSRLEFLARHAVTLPSGN